MREQYPADSTIPDYMLVPEQDQPDFLLVEHLEPPDRANAGMEFSSEQVKRGRGSLVAAIDVGSQSSFTYSELDELSWGLASRLIELGLNIGDRVAIRTPNVSDVLIVALGVWKAGGVVVPTPATARSGELEFLLRDTGARFFFVFGRSDVVQHVPDALVESSVEHLVTFGSREAILGTWWLDLPCGGRAEAQARAESIRSHSVAVVWHTGGTSGQPKACYSTHRRVIVGSRLMGATCDTRIGDRRTAAAPVGHAFGFAFHTGWTLAHGATAVFVDRFADETALLDAVLSQRVDCLAGITISWARLIEEVERRETRGELVDLSCLRVSYAMWQSASASAVYGAWMARGIELLNNFGSTSFWAWVLAPDPAGGSPRSSLGRPASDHEVIAVSFEDDSVDVSPIESGAIGRMAVRGPTGLTYWNRPNLQIRDVVEGWTLVDDLIEFDSAGYAHYLGRTDFLISSAGFKVAPGEVEEALSTHPSVREVCVVGLPDPLRQEVVAAFVALNEGYGPSVALELELKDFVKGRLTPHKYPRRVEFVDNLPRDHVGKLQPRALREAALRGGTGS